MLRRIDLSFPSKGFSRSAGFFPNNPQIMNLKTGESYLGRLAITGNHQTYLPTEIQEMLKESGRIRIQILGG